MGKSALIERIKMIYIVCDMNCNNFGNYFRVLGLEYDLEQDKNHYIIENGYYPKGHCYRAKMLSKPLIPYRYSEAIDILIPEDYIRWKETRFKGKRR